MPIVFELIVLMLASYGLGMALGWAAWGRSTRIEAEPDRGIARKGEPEE